MKVGGRQKLTVLLGKIAHSSASRLMAEDERMEAWVGAGIHEMEPAAGRVVDGLKKWRKGMDVWETVGYTLLTI